MLYNWFYRKNIWNRNSVTTNKLCFQAPNYRIINTFLDTPIFTYSKTRRKPTMSHLYVPTYCSNRNLLFLYLQDCKQPFSNKQFVSLALITHNLSKSPHKHQPQNYSTTQHVQVHVKQYISWDGKHSSNTQKLKQSLYLTNKNTPFRCVITFKKS